MMESRMLPMLITSIKSLVTHVRIASKLASELRRNADESSYDYHTKVHTIIICKINRSYAIK